MEGLDQKWVERIWERLECIYKEKWPTTYGDPKKRFLLLTQWCTGLSGLIAKDILRAITMCECSNRDSCPTVIEFYHLAKGLKVLPRSKIDPAYNVVDRSIAVKYLADIRAKLPRQRSM